MRTITINKVDSNYINIDGDMIKMSTFIEDAQDLDITKLLMRGENNHITLFVMEGDHYDILNNETKEINGVFITNYNYHNIIKVIHIDSDGNVTESFRNNNSYSCNITHESYNNLEEVKSVLLENYVIFKHDEGHYLCTQNTDDIIPYHTVSLTRVTTMEEFDVSV